MNEQTQSASVPKKERNLYISYIKGAAIIGVVLIHVTNWSNVPLSWPARIIESVLHASVLLFVLAAGSVVFVAYERKSFREQVKRTFYRGGQLLFVYYLYSLVKLLVYNFSTEPFYEQFTKIGTLTASNILSFRSFTVPITVLITYPFLLVFSPLLLLLSKKVRRSEWIILAAAIGLFLVDYYTGIQSLTSPFIKFIYANGFVLFPIALWLVPFILGFFLAQVGFEKQRRWILLVGIASTIFYGTQLFLSHQSISLDDYEFPLAPYFIASGLLTLGFLLYAFRPLEKMRQKWVRGSLAAIRLLGDNTLNIYVYQWVVIDLTIWIFYPLTGLIWLTVPAYLAAFLYAKRKKFIEYYHHQTETAKALGAEIL
jgi:hypothetical protein